MPASGLRFKQYALCVSTLEPRKNIDLLLKAYRLLPILLRQAKPLVLIGSAGWAGDDLKQAIANAVAEGWLIHLGFVDEQLLPYYFAGACSFIYPSKYEGFGLPIIEAIASGTAVIANDILLRCYVKFLSKKLSMLIQKA
ncbi:glycosyltransferase [Deefgea sp. CFH1-16]|uniref:glycosyltransferase n=1 Tax=Deefgea sp. CFH1-16 TaxID=2675457 RepID=UPI0015F5C509|nr:glycosyltransferase [Deefgea sp. CFH1-16]MBM5574157.1 glycosyltransferase [Deefgea sp. CFH1-16]